MKNRQAAKNKMKVTQEKTGGAYNDIKANGGQRHHMPAKDASNLSTGEGPSIRMETADHMKTASWGRSKSAQAYRAKQAKLIKDGKFKQAQKMDIKDVKSKFGKKYNKSVKEMKQYTK